MLQDTQQLADRIAPEPPLELLVKPRYTSRMQKGGAMLEEMRQLVLLWHDGPEGPLKAEVIRRNELNRATRARLGDVLSRIFVPRFVHCPMLPGAWKLMAPLERRKASTSMVRPLYFWITALTEPILYDFCVEYLARRRELEYRMIDVNDAAAWVATKGNGWSEVVTIKLTRAMLAALRDFGVLEGRAKKQLVTPRVPVASFAYLAFCLHQRGVVARRILDHPDWRLFAMMQGDVEELFFEAHQMGMLEYHAAGSTIRLTFPVATAEEYANVVLGR